MVTLQLVEQVSEIPQEHDANEKDVTQWSFCTPCAGVKYYAFEASPARRERVELTASDDTTPDAG